VASLPKHWLVLIVRRGSHPKAKVTLSSRENVRTTMNTVFMHSSGLIQFIKAQIIRDERSRVFVGLLSEARAASLSFMRGAVAQKSDIVQVNV
jgi:hypothetical protein